MLPLTPPGAGRAIDKCQKRATNMKAMARNSMKPCDCPEPLTILGYTIEEARDYQRFWRNAASQAARYGDWEQCGRDWRTAERFYDEAEEALSHGTE